MPTNNWLQQMPAMPLKADRLGIATPALESRMIAVSLPDTSLSGLPPKDASVAQTPAAESSNKEEPPLTGMIHKVLSYITIFRPALLTWDEISNSGWYQENPCIIRGYRPVSNSFKTSLESLLYMHNETINIFSHLLPSIFFIAAEGYIYTYFPYKFPESKILDRLVFALYLLTAAVCMACSAAYHTVLNHSEKVAKTSLQYDLAGILVLTWGIFWSAIYVAFYCETNIRWRY